MRHSFIRPRKKYLISPEMRLVLFFFGMTLFMLVSSYLFLAYKQYDFGSQMADMDAKSAELNSSIAAMDSRITFIQSEAAKAEQVYTANTVMKESIKNLFDLVPDRIVLSEAELKDDSLILYGVTPNKEIYEFMLHAPLRSIFHRTYSSFYPLENGWYRFVSSNFLDEEELTQ
jgi:outer membrane murein-binding lipoprotein Lpp